MNTSDPSASAPCRRVLCIGDMAADILASPMPRLPQPGELLLADRIACFPGGNALNTAVALRRLGESVSFAGSLGDDPLGDLLMAQLQAIRMDLRGVRRESGSTTPATLVYRARDEDRRYISSLGTADRFTGEHVPPELIPEDGVLLAAGYYKLRAWDDDALVRVLRQARQRRCTTVLNVCLPAEGMADPERCRRLLPHVDLFVLNDDEARVLAGDVGPEDQTRMLRGAGANAVVITRGPGGLYARDERCAVEMGAFSVPVVDPSGCGDCFIAGLIAGILRRWELVKALVFASALGALGATELGCTSGVPPFADVERFVAANNVDVSVRAAP